MMPNYFFQSSIYPLLTSFAGSLLEAETMESTVLAIKGDKDTNPLKVLLVPWSKPYIKLQERIILIPAIYFSFL